MDNPTPAAREKIPQKTGKTLILNNKNRYMLTDFLQGGHSAPGSKILVEICAGGSCHRRNTVKLGAQVGGRQERPGLEKVVHVNDIGAETDNGRSHISKISFPRRLNFHLATFPDQTQAPPLGGYGVTRNRGQGGGGQDEHPEPGHHKPASG
jgi:hypothetical protein